MEKQMDKNKRANIDPGMAAILMLATVFGAAVRLSLPLNSITPINDGGLFYSMIHDIRANGFVLPIITSYNIDNIPFAYPPISLYMTALISALFHIPTFDLLRLLPPILSALCIPAFYLLAKEFTSSKPRIALAVLIFSFIPRTFDWHIMGGGITRAPGFLLALLAIRQFYLVFKTRSSGHVPLAILFGALTVMTHPEAAVHSVIAALVFYLGMDRTLTGLARGAGIAAGVAVLSAPWWLTVILHHGLGGLSAPFTAVGQDNISLPLRFAALFRFQFTDEPLISILAVLGLLGAALLLARKEFILPLWLAASSLLEPRGAAQYMIVPLALMAAAALELLILPALRGRLVEPAAPSWLNDLLQDRSVRVLLGFLTIYILVAALLMASSLYRTITLKPADLKALQWVQANTPAASRFVLITGENALAGPTSEWFPALTGRRSQATLFGYEWVNDAKFAARRAAHDALQACINRDLACLEEWSRETGLPFDYVYLSKYMEGRPNLPALAVYLTYSAGYQKVYDSESVVIFRRLSSGQ